MLVWMKDRLTTGAGKAKLKVVLLDTAVPRVMTLVSVPTALAKNCRDAPADSSGLTMQAVHHHDAALCLALAVPCPSPTYSGNTSVRAWTFR